MNNHKISDTFLAATLVALGISIADIDRTNPQRCIFLFESSELVDQYIQQYLLNQLKVNPATLLQSYKYVLSQLHDNRPDEFLNR